MVLLTIGDQFLAPNLAAVIGGRLLGVDPEWPDDDFTTVTGDVDEILRVLDAQRSDQLCAWNRKKGHPTVVPGALPRARGRS